MSAPPLARCPCPACVAAAALVLLDGGRAGMARAVLADLPALIRGAVAEAYAEGVEHGVEAARKACPGDGTAPGRAPAPPRGSPPPAPAFARLAAELAAHVEHLGAYRVAELLGVGLDDLGPLLEGRVAPPTGRMRRLREAPG